MYEEFDSPTHVQDAVVYICRADSAVSCEKRGELLLVPQALIEIQIENEKLRAALQAMWDQFACTATDGCDCAGCSALEDAADTLGIEE